MATQSGVTVAGPNEPYTIVTDIKRPKPGPKQILVKSLVTGVNPVESFMQHSGILVIAWPAVLGCEAAGVVIEKGSDVTNFDVGDYAFGCTNVGQNSCSTFQETFVMDAHIAYKKSPTMSLEQASTIGVNLDTAALCLIAGTEVELPAPGTTPEKKGEWIIVLGGSGGVGQFGVQLAHLAGYKVLASCSPAKASIPTGAGADATFSHRLSTDEQLAEIKKITEGKFARVFDTTAQSQETAWRALQEVSTAEKKWFATVDDWSDWKTPSPIHEYRVHLGLLGREDDEIGKAITTHLASWIPTLEGHLKNGALKPLEYLVVDGEGWEAVLEGVKVLEGGKASKKLAVKLQKE